MPAAAGMPARRPAADDVAACAVASAERRAPSDCRQGRSPCRRIHPALVSGAEARPGRHRGERQHGERGERAARDHDSRDDERGPQRVHSSRCNRAAAAAAGGHGSRSSPRSGGRRALGGSGTARGWPRHSRCLHPHPSSPVGPPRGGQAQTGRSTRGTMGICRCGEPCCSRRSPGGSCSASSSRSRSAARSGSPIGAHRGSGAGRPGCGRERCPRPRSPIPTTTSRTTETAVSSRGRHAEVARDRERRAITFSGRRWGSPAGRRPPDRAASPSSA